MWRLPDTSNMVTQGQSLDLQSVWCVMNHDTELLIRSLLAFAFTWAICSAFHYSQKEKMQKHYRKTLSYYLQENRRLRQGNAELSYELSKLTDKK